MNNDYELLESLKNENKTWTRLRHKKTGLEIVHNQYESTESGFSFCFRTPVEEPYSGVTHVLEHCVLCGSQKYDVDFWELQNLSFITSSNAVTDEYGTIYFVNSLDDAEIFKIIPIMADYVFFPILCEEAFMQEAFRVEFDSNGDGRKKEIVSIIYNEMKSSPPETYYAGGLYYKLHELTNEKIKDYHRKYYRPDNCLFYYNGSAALDDVLLQLNKLLPELEEKFTNSNLSSQKNPVVKDYIKKLSDKTFSEDFEFYWCSYNSDFKAPPLPPKKSVPAIISEYLSKYNKQEYQTKLEKLHKWQARNLQETAYKILSPHHISDYEIELNTNEELLYKKFEQNENWINSRDKHHLNVYTKINKNSCQLFIRASQLLSREYYAEYALMFFMQKYFLLKLRKLGRIYSGGFSYNFPADFVLSAYATDKPKKTIEFIKNCFNEIAVYNFTEIDVLSIKYSIYTFLLSQRYPNFYFTDEIFSIKAEELKQAAIRFRNKIFQIKESKNDETYYYCLGDILKK